MIHYHGGPITPVSAGVAVWQKRHGLVSFAHPQQIGLAAELCQSFILDNGAFTLWKAGKGRVDVPAYAAWVSEWRLHPGFDFALIPDVIDGSEDDNNIMIAQYREAGGDLGQDVPVWHMHESLDRLNYLSRAYRRVALGSSGQWARVGTDSWWSRMGEVMAAVCDSEGRPRCKLHGLRMLNPAVFTRLPLASADSSSVARNIGFDSRWKGTFAPLTKDTRALVLADRFEHFNSAASWSPEEQGEEEVA